MAQKRLMRQECASQVQLALDTPVQPVLHVVR